MEEAELKKIEEDLDKSFKESSSLHEMQLNITRDKIDSELKNLINNYSNEIRNISIASGIIAPFSLTLLDIEKLEISTPSILIGFILLLVNIAISNFLINRFVKNKDKKITRATMNWIFAEFNTKEMKDSNKDYNQRINNNFDYMKNMDKVNEALGFSYLNISSEKEKVELRKYNKISILLFIFGLSFIIISIFINPLINIIYKLI